MYRRVSDISGQSNFQVYRLSIEGAVQACLVCPEAALEAGELAAENLQTLARCCPRTTHISFTRAPLGNTPWLQPKTMML